MSYAPRSALDGPAATVHTGPNRREDGWLWPTHWIEQKGRQMKALGETRATAE